MKTESNKLGLINSDETMLLPKNVPPTHPGEILLEEFLVPLEITQRDFAKKVGVSLQRLNELINAKRGMTAETAILISRELKTDPSWWLRLQEAVDLWEAERKLQKVKLRRHA